MPQGKFKKVKIPDSLRKLQHKKAKHGVAFTRRSNAPIQPKKGKCTVQEKLKQVISKSVNKSAEEELRGLASESKLNLSKAQEAVIQHHQAKTLKLNLAKPEICEEKSSK